MHYVKYIKKQFAGVNAYDEMGNMLDLSYLKGIRQNGRFSKKNQDDIILNMQKKMPGRLNFIEITSYPERGLVSMPYGLLYKLMDKDHYIKNTGNIMQIYSLRDCFLNRNPDYINRNIIARYYIKFAEFAAIEKNPVKFNFYREAAEQAGIDIPNVLRGIAYIFFADLNDAKTAMLYLEKSMENDPYDFPTINLIIDIYTRLQMWDMALKWYKFYYDREWDPARRERIYGAMQALRVRRSRRRRQKCGVKNALPFAFRTKG
jgi:tetratricopeptide (TPR) repeat protein